MRCLFKFDRFVNKNKRIIAIDGPAGSGKSTTARLVAEHLGFTYLDTGALYRALTYLALKKGVAIHDGRKLAELLQRTRFEVEPGAEKSVIRADGVDITDYLRGPEVTHAVSIVARQPEVRTEMVDLQRRIAETGKFVVEGRDIGTVIFPDAILKIFLDASIEVRTERRLKDLRAQGMEIDFETLKQEITRRDKIDAAREASPLKKAEDAVVVDTTGLSISQQVEKIVQAYRQMLHPEAT